MNKTTKEVDLVIEFGGFYDSEHSNLVDNYIELLSNEDENLWERIDYKNTYLEYCKEYTLYLFKYIEEEYGITLDIPISNLKIESPREYNFYTDIIIIPNINSSNRKKLRALFSRLLKNKNFKEYITYITIPHSGYIPHYSYKEIVNYKNEEISYRSLLSFICKQFNKEDLYEFDWINKEIVIFYREEDI
jgi:hypothetical protein